jgi:hypothetical protein
LSSNGLLGLGLLGLGLLKFGLLRFGLLVLELPLKFARFSPKGAAAVVPAGRDSGAGSALTIVPVHSAVAAKENGTASKSWLKGIAAMPGATEDWP